MPYKDPEKAKEHARRYRAENRDKLTAYYKQWRKDNAEKVRIGHQKWQRENRDRVRELQRANPRQTRRVQIHGLYADVWFAQAWAEQEGCCYLCGDEMSLSRAVIDHDHDHCGIEKSCSLCRRGLACSRCNSLIGLADENPERLHRIASNLERRLSQKAWIETETLF